MDYTDSEPPRFERRVALITNSNTESQPEVLSAICKEYGCARIIGERTAGAFNGWTEAIGLPAKFARFAVPYTRSVSPRRIEKDAASNQPKWRSTQELISKRAETALSQRLFDTFQGTAQSALYNARQSL